MKYVIQMNLRKAFGEKLQGRRCLYYYSHFSPQFNEKIKAGRIIWAEYHNARMFKTYKEAEEHIERHQGLLGDCDIVKYEKKEDFRLRLAG